ncbi:MAG TPA: UBP-type zinc finger domain-containing protein [Blastocatellia bacterium]|nr:UBP-type zinc finger domain-containing protein [Blastocatellia bacterium]
MPSIKSSECPHFKETNSQAIEVNSTRCAECGLENPTRVCMTCGHIGCCESRNGHALAHSKSSDHPLIRQLPISDNSFTWCYGCNAYLT